VDDIVQESRNAEEKAKKAITDVGQSNIQCHVFGRSLFSFLINNMMTIPGCHDG